MPLVPASSRGADLGQANTWTGNQTAPAWIASGLTGATAASRYVGATASGAPASGAFVVGDFAIDQTGKVYVCTVAGSPGTWVQVGGSAGGVTVKDYTAFTSPVSVTGTAEGTPTTVVSGGSFTADGTTQYCVEVSAPGAFSGSGNPGNIRNFLVEAQGATILGQFGIVLGSGSAITVEAPLYQRVYTTPAAGTRSYTWKAFRLNANGGIDVGAGGSGAFLPGFIRVTSGS